MMIPDSVIEAMAEQIFWRRLSDKEAKADEVRAALKAAEAAGFKLVPREPDKLMVTCGNNVAKMDCTGAWVTDAAECYRAMWLAAPGVGE